MNSFRYVAFYSTAETLDTAYVIGGQWDSSSIVAQYNNDTWQRLSDMKNARFGHASIVVGDEALIIGGWRNEGVQKWACQTDFKLSRAFWLRIIYLEWIVKFGNTKREQTRLCRSTKLLSHHYQMVNIDMELACTLLTLIFAGHENIFLIQKYLIYLGYCISVL